MNSDHALAELYRIDVNLLVAFDTLLRERNVTRAAERAGVTQSAMSHKLRRLRELFGDPLLVRGRGGMVPTPRAEALSRRLRQGLVALARTLGDPDGFDPQRASRVFRIVSPDLFDLLELPGLLERLAVEAPRVQVAIVPLPERLLERLETGDVDVAIVPELLDETASFGEATPLDLTRRTLFRDAFCCFVRAGHPLLERPGGLTLEAFTELGHILVSPRGEGPGLVDQLLSARGLERRVTCRVPSFASALAITARSDLVLTGPEALGKIAEGRLVRLPAPLPLPRHAITMVWHPRYTADPAHRWLRDLIGTDGPTPTR